MSALAPVMRWRAGDADVVTKARVTARGGGLRLIGVDAADRYYIADQDADGRLTLLCGPVDLGVALAAAQRVLAGSEGRITEDSIAVAGALVGVLAPEGAPC